MGQRKNGKFWQNFCILLCSLLYFNKVNDALKIKNTDIAKELSLPPVKLHCSMLAEDAIKAALKDYQVKQSSMKKDQENRNAATQ